MNRLRALWISLPPFWKSALVLGIGSASGALKHALTQPCQSSACWKGYLLSAAHAGGLAIAGYLMESPLGKQLLPAESSSAPANAPPQA